MSWEAAYDRWKTTPPEPDEVVVCECEQCGFELLAGMEVVRDEWDLYFCDMGCARRYAEEKLADVLEDYEDLDDYEDKCLSYTILEAPEPPEYEDIVGRIY